MTRKQQVKQQHCDQEAAPPIDYSKHRCAPLVYECVSFLQRIEHCGGGIAKVQSLYDDTVDHHP